MAKSIRKPGGREPVAKVCIGHLLKAENRMKDWRVDQEGQREDPIIPRMNRMSSSLTVALLLFS